MEPNEQKKQEEKPTKDLFNIPLEPIQPPKQVEKQEEQKKPDFDVASHPTVVEMNKKIADMSSNLSAQNKLIEKRDKKIKELEEGLKKGQEAQAEEFKPPFPTIRRSKDLTEDEKEEMTSNEIKMIDDLAASQEAANKAAKEAFEAKAASKKTEEKSEEEDEPNLVEESIKELAGSDEERKRELGEVAKMVNFDGLKTKEQITERLKTMAEKLIPAKERKEQQTSHGKAVQEGTAKDDPFGSFKIIEEARQGQNGNYAL